MANTTISALPSATTPLSGTEVVPIVQSGVTKKVAASDIAVSGGVKSFQTSLSGLTPSTTTTGAVTLAGTLGPTSGGTGLTSFTANGVVYASSSSALTTGSALSFDGANLGIGTSSPSQKLQINASGASPAWLYSTNGTSGSYFGTSGTGETIVYQTGAYPIQFYTNSTERMRLDSSGNLGIGTSSPGAKLQVNGSGDSPAYTSTTTRIFSTDALAANKGGSILFGGVYTGTTAAGWAGIAGLKNNATDGDYGSYLGFYTRLNGSSIVENMRLDSAGNLGLGVTPSAWQSGWKVLEIGNAGNAIANDSATSLRLTSNARFAGSTWIYASTNVAATYAINGGAHVWNIAPSGTAGNAITFTQAMTLDASGNLGIGTTSPGAPLTVEKASAYIQVNSTGVGATYTRYHNSGGPYIYAGVESSAGASVVPGTSAYSAIFGTDGAYPVQFFTNNSVKATLDSSGNLLVGTTSVLTVNRKLQVTDGGAGVPAIFKQTNSATNECLDLWNNATTGNNVFVEFQTEAASTARGTISFNRAAVLVSYNTTSDYRSKDIIGPVQDSGATIDALKVYEGQMKGATQSRPMLIAHEAQAVTPYAVTGEKDAVKEDGTPDYQQMDVSSLVPLLIAEVQSLRIRIAQLEAK